MKLTHVILYYPSMEKGGIEVNIRHLLKYLTNKGIKVTLISNKINTKGLGINKRNFKLINKKDKKKYNSQKVITKNYRFFDMIYKKFKPYNLIVKIDVEGHQLTVIKEIKKSKIFNSISIMYIENENNYKAKTKLQKMLPKFKLIKIDKIINFKDSNINMVFEKKRKNEK